MPRLIYQAEHIEFLRSTYVEFGLEETTRLFNFAFGLDKSPGQIKSTLLRHNIKCGRTNGQLRKGVLKAFTDEQAEWIREAYKQMKLADMVEAFNKTFGTNKTLSQVRAFTRNHRVHSGRDGQFKPGNTPCNKGVKGWQAGGASVMTQFKRGNQPHNHQPVGTEVVDADGYLKRKVGEPNRWAFVHRLVWEQHNGTIPDGQMVRFLDGDSMNCDINNLTLVDRGAHAILNRHSKPLSEFEPEHRTVVVETARVQSKVAQLRSSR